MKRILIVGLPMTVAVATLRRRSSRRPRVPAKVSDVRLAIADTAPEHQELAPA
jgi:hypothetical protein